MKPWFAAGVTILICAMLAHAAPVQVKNPVTRRDVHRSLSNRSEAKVNMMSRAHSEHLELADTPDDAWGSKISMTQRHLLPQLFIRREFLEDTKETMPPAASVAPLAQRSEETNDVSIKPNTSHARGSTVPTGNDNTHSVRKAKNAGVGPTQAAPRLLNGQEVEESTKREIAYLERVLNDPDSNATLRSNAQLNLEFLRRQEQEKTEKERILKIINNPSSTEVERYNARENLAILRECGGGSSGHGDQKSPCPG